MKKTIFTTAAVLGLLAVLLGAFGAHGLKKWVDAQAVASFETGVRYQMYHAIFLFILGLLPKINDKAKKAIYIFMVAGVLLFSFSIYLLALKGRITMDVAQIAFVTPIGGALLITGWSMLLYQFITMKKTDF
jgi:uncharacterized membrane protein YgdD (TMEM256/DUF423 family)